MTNLPTRADMDYQAGEGGGVFTTAILAFFDTVLQLIGIQPATELTIAAGIVTPARGNHTIDTEANAAADDLTHIDQTNLPDGSRVTIRCVDAARVVTVKNNQAGAGEILMVDGADFVLDAIDKFLVLERRGTAWTEIRRWYGNDKGSMRAFAGLVVGTDVLAPTGDGSGLSGITAGASETDMRLAFLMIAENAGDRLNMVDGFADPFTDESDVDTVASSNEIYDPTGYFYGNRAADSSEDGGYVANSTYNLAWTWVDRTWAVNNGATVTKIAFFNNQATGTCTVKIFLENTTTSFDVVVSESFPFDGSGWQIFTLATPYVVPATGTYRAGIYTPAVVYTVQSAAVTMSIKAGDVTGAPATGFTASTYNPPLVRVYYQGAVGNMSLLSNAFAATSTPATGRIHIQVNPIDAVTINTDLTAEISRDGGTSWTTAVLALKQNLADGTVAYEDEVVAVSAQLPGTSVKYRIKTFNNKELQVHGVVMQWS